MGDSRRAPLTSDEQAELLALAVATIRSGLVRQPIAGLTAPSGPGVVAIGASFVTLERDGALLGCIGTLEPVRPLYEDVMQNAYRSAFADPRLPPVGADDYVAMDVKISVLTPSEPVVAATRSELLGVLRPGVDGVLLTDGRRRSTFLPAVWEKFPDPKEFLDLLLVKGGWRRGTWPVGLRVSRYAAVEFADHGPRPAAVATPEG